MNKCLTYKGECINTAYVYMSEPSDTLSGLVRRCAKIIDIAKAWEVPYIEDIHDMCLQAGQTEEQTYITCMAAEQLAKSREV